jgi:hypothetical protein
MRVRLVVEVEANHVSGPFVSRDDMIEHIKDNIGEPDVSVNDSEYEVGDWSVDELPDDHCDGNIRQAATKLLNEMETGLYTKQANRLRKLLGIPQRGAKS